MDFSILFNSSVHVAHKFSKPRSGRFPRNSPIVANARHFRRESLFSKGTKQPEDVVQRCLTHFRKCDLPSLSQYLSDGSSSTNSPPVLLVGNKQVEEEGTLACLHPVLDLGARRVLPGHLLRRSRVLGTLRLSPLQFQQRVALTAQTGEESVFTWHLRWVEQPELEDNNQVERWVISKIERESEEQQKDGGGIGSGIGTREATSNNNRLPSTPQPKSSPESVVYAQLQALRRGDVYEASQFNTWREPSSSEKEGGSRLEGVQASNGPSLGLQFELLRDILVEHPYKTLVNHTSAVLGPAALPTQHSMLQEVWVKCGVNGCVNSSDIISSARGDWVRFIWSLHVESSNGCWMCTNIEPYLEDT